MRVKRPLCLVCIGFIVFVAVTQAVWRPRGVSFTEEEAVLSGTVYDKEYKTSAYSDRASPVVCLNHISWKESQVSGKINGVLCYLKEGEALPAVGSRITVRGRLKPFKRATNPGEFDQEEYYLVKGLAFGIEKACVIKQSGGSAAGEALYRIKCLAARIFERTLGEKDASVMKTMLLGSKSELDADVKKLYQSAGISHILAISGLHIGLIGMGLFKLMRKAGLPVRGAALICLLMVWAYGEMTGMGPSAARAALMLSLQLFALCAGRSYDMLTSLAFAAALLLAGQPLYMKDPAFLLSFGAAAGIGLLYPGLRGIFRKRLSKPVGFIADGMSCGFSVFFGTLPVTLNSFYQIPVYAQLLNLFVIPFLSLLLPAGILVLFTAGWCPPAARAAAALCHVILGVFEGSCGFVSKLPGAVWTVGGVPGIRTAMYYVLLALFIRLSGTMPPKFRVYWLLSALFLAVRPPACAGAQITMLDVGQGDCFLIRCEGRNILVDGGSSSSKSAGTRQILPALKYFGIDRLDYVFISHLDADHYNGVEEFLKEGEVRAETLFFPYPDQKEEVRQRLAALAGKSYLLREGDELKAGGLTILCLHPCEQESFADTNATSLVLELRYRDFCMLFTGDMGVEQEEKLLEALEGEDVPGKTTVLKVAHHGSDYSTSERLLKALRPTAAFLSCAMENPYGHPGEELLGRLKAQHIPVYQTRYLGAVTLNVTGRDCRIKVWAQLRE